MTKLKLDPIKDDKPVKVTLKLPAGLHRDLVAYAEILDRGNGQIAPEAVRLIVPMLSGLSLLIGDSRKCGERRYHGLRANEEIAPYIRPLGSRYLCPEADTVRVKSAYIRSR